MRAIPVLLEHRFLDVIIKPTLRYEKLQCWQSPYRRIKEYIRYRRFLEA